MLTAQLNNSKKGQKGFTLIELLVVIGILAILLAIVLIAINPARQFGQANNTRRISDVTQILNAIGAYEADNAGQLPSTIPLNTASPAYIDANDATLCAAIVPNYIPSLPVDPTVNNGAAYTTCAAATTATGYHVSKDANGHVTVTASITDNSATISNTR